MTEQQLFFAVFAGVLAANLLTVVFVWSCVKIGRNEARQESVGTYMIGFLMPLAFCAAALYVIKAGV